MDTQNTAIHIRLWQRPFWLLSISKFLLCMTVYMLIPILPYWMMSQVQFDGSTMPFVFLCYLVGVVLPGPFSSFLVQRFRRNNVALLAMHSFSFHNSPCGVFMCWLVALGHLSDLCRKF